MAFFLFSFQVHEKSILIPMLSALLALAGKGNKRRDSLRSSAHMVGGGLMGDDESVWEASVLVLNVATYRYV
jgi:hypothetical protein